MLRRPNTVIESLQRGENSLSLERTFAIIKPDAVSRGQQGEILARIHKAGFKIFAMVLEAEGAILKWRDTMGATDPKKAAPGTIRYDLGTSIGNNCTHGSDAPETAAFEIGYFFSGSELI